MHSKAILFSLMLLWMLFQNCSGDKSIKFFNDLLTLKSHEGGGPYEGKPKDGYYCRVFDNISCQAQIQNLQGLVKVDNSKIHLLEDNCTSTSVNFLVDDSAVSFSSLASDFIGLSRAIFKKCEVGSDNLPAPSNEMTDAYCVSNQDDMVVVINKSLTNNAFTFDLFFKNNSLSREVRGGSVNKSPNSLGDGYISASHEFKLAISSSNSQTAAGHLQAVIDEKSLSVDLNCRVASPKPTLVISDDLEISPSWIDTSQLVGYWKLNEPNATNGTVILDSSKFATNGILATDNGALVKSNSSVIGGSLSFDGSNDSVDVPMPADGHLSFDLRSFTYMAWINKTGNARGFDMPISHGGGSANATGYNIECGTGQCRASISDDSGQPAVYAMLAPDGDNLIGQWVLLTVVVDRDLRQLRTYFNGAKVTTVDISTTGSLTPKVNLQIGGSLWPFMGLVDDVSIWNRALSENEIRDIFQRLRPKFY